MWFFRNLKKEEKREKEEREKEREEEREVEVKEDDLIKINKEFYCLCDRIPLKDISKLSCGDSVGIAHGNGVSCGFVVSNDAEGTVVKVHERGRGGGDWNEYTFVDGQLQRYGGYLCGLKFRSKTLKLKTLKLKLKE